MAHRPVPITIADALKSMSDLIAQIRRKNTTMIDYYIYPEPVPSEIQAHDPRLAILDARVKSLSAISYPNLAYLMDSSTALAASYVNTIVDQLLNAIHGFEEIFEGHYDRTLKEKKPYGTIYKILEHRESQLKDLMLRQMQDQRSPRPEDLRPNGEIYFCRGAVQLINNRDRGRITFVERSELLRENRNVMEKFGGAFLWWQCPACDYRLRFHVASSMNSSIHTNEEVREDPGIPIEYRSTFLGKSHLFSEGFAQYAPKYGCLFCFAEGKALDSEKETVFRSGRALAEHIQEKHRKKLPASLLLQKFCVAVNGKMADQVRRWDINLK